MRKFLLFCTYLLLPILTFAQKTEKSLGTVQNYTKTDTKTNIDTADGQEDPALTQARQYYETAVEEFNKNDLTGAYADVCKSVDLYSTSENNYMRGYLALNFAQNYSQALESVTYCINNNYNLGESYKFLGEIYVQQYTLPEAIKAFNKAIDINPKDVEAWAERGLCKSRDNDINGAIADYQEALKYEGTTAFDYATLYNNIANCYHRGGDYSNAKLFITEALNRTHLSTYIWNTDGLVAYLQGRYSDAITSANNAITIDSTNENAYYVRGVAEMQLGMKADGYRDLQKAKALGEEDAIPELDKIDAKTIDFSKTSNYARVINQPTVQSTKSHTVITCIKATNERTELYLRTTNNNEATIFGIEPNAYIRDRNTGKTYKLLSSVNCAILPNTTPIGGNGATVESVLIFPAIPKDCNLIDFFESDESSWQFYGIQLK